MGRRAKTKTKKSKKKKWKETVWSPKNFAAKEKNILGFAQCQPNRTRTREKSVKSGYKVAAAADTEHTQLQLSKPSFFRCDTDEN